MTFANGMALSPDKDHLYVAESFAGRVIRIPIDESGDPQEGELFVEGFERVPDGLAFDTAGNLYISCYEPSRIYRVSPEREIHLFIDDPIAHTSVPSDELCVSRRRALHIQPRPVAHNADRSPLRGPHIALNGSLAQG